jgi:hypothetical protein
MSPRIFVRRIGLLALFLLILTASQGCTTVHTVAAAEPMPREGNVILVRGLMDVFSLGLNDIGDELVAEGVNAHVCSGPRWGSVSDQIKLEHDEGRLEGPLVIVGHSYGADDAVRLARSLGDGGIQVDMLALIDPTTPPKIPANVMHCFNLYKSNTATDWIPLLRGIPVEAENPETEVVNYNIRDHNADGRYDWNNHFNIEEDRDVQQTIIEQVLKFCPPNGHYAGASPSASAPLARNSTSSSSSISATSASSPSTGSMSHAGGNGGSSGGDNFADAQPR